MAKRLPPVFVNVLLIFLSDLVRYAMLVQAAV
jgi:hypothetical protein